MTKDDFEAMRVDVAALLEKHWLGMDGDSPLEGLMLWIASRVDEEREAQQDELVAAVLESAVTNLRHAATDYYVSFK